MDSIVIGYNYVLGAKLCVRRYVGFHPLKTNREKVPSPKRSRAKNSEENLEKDSPHVLFVFAWYERLSCIRPEIVVQLVNMEKGFVWFPTIACLSKTCPADSEFHSGALVSVAPMAVEPQIPVRYDGRPPKVLSSLGHS